MFGNPIPPKPPRHQPLLLLVLAVLIATVLTLAAYGFLVLAERLERAGRGGGMAFEARVTLTDRADCRAHSSVIADPAMSKGGLRCA